MYIVGGGIMVVLAIVLVIVYMVLARRG